MKQAYTYKTISHSANAEFSDRGSKFIAWSYAVNTTDEIKSALKKLKEQHPKAVHFCYAWRLGFDGTAFRANDDGEPGGSAGRPILGQIDSLQITNVLLVVVRYFGGVLLGVPGLINAYKHVSQMALAQSGVLIKSRMNDYRITFDYTQMNEVMRIVKAHHCEIVSQEMMLFCEMHIRLPLTDEEKILQKLREIQALEMTLLA